MGGGAMRIAAKVVAAGAVNGGVRGFAGEHPIAAVATAARKAARPASACVSASSDVESNVLVASQKGKIDSSVQRLSSEFDDWELAFREDEVVVQSREPMPRLVFGGVPTLNEAKNATSELKDAFEMVSVSSPKSISSSDDLENKVCVTSETSVISVPQHAFQALKFLNESPRAQNVVASIACDSNVWNAVMQNEALLEFLKTNTDPTVNNADADKEDDDDVSRSEDTKNGRHGLLHTVKDRVVRMMSSLSGYFAGFFGDPAKQNESTDGYTHASATAGVFVGLAIMVILMVVLKRV